MPPEEGYRAPSFAIAYPCSVATMPAMRNESHTTAPASPRRAKIPAPTMEPTPRKTAPRTVIAPRPCRASAIAGIRSAAHSHSEHLASPAMG
jgi:hypothetical protein